MTEQEIFSNVLTHEIKGIMIHEQFADYYDFLNLKGFKALHEHRYKSESEDFRKTKCFYIKRYGKLVKTQSVNQPNVIPDSWYGYTKDQLTGSIISNAVKNGFDMWVDWEKKSVKVYEEAYKNLQEIGEDVSALYMLDMAKCNSAELDDAKSEMLNLKMCDYDINTILDEQD